MPSPLKGEVTFQAGGETVRLSFSAEALYRLEKALGLNVNQISAMIQDSSQFSMELIRTLFWAGLLDNRPDLGLEDVGAILSKVSPRDAIGHVTSAFGGAFSDGSESVADRPPVPGQAAAGTGSDS